MKPNPTPLSLPTITSSIGASALLVGFSCVLRLNVYAEPLDPWWIYLIGIAFFSAALCGLALIFQGVPQRILVCEAFGLPFVYLALQGITENPARILWLLIPFLAAIAVSLYRAKNRHDQL
ncbi:hypothetical protein EON81_19360 [bacterium]|nr:MAG: hypothetical protein EON81_19360 [bacterium]